MFSIKASVNTALGFKPYNIVNKTGWIKEVNCADGYTSIFKKLPTGTIIKETKDSKGFLWCKRGLLQNGKEMQSYIGDSVGNKVIHITNPKGGSIYAQTKKYYNFQTQQYESMVIPSKFKHLYSFIDKIKMHMGIL